MKQPQPDPKSKDTSLPGREEEVIVNEQEQEKIINTDDPTINKNSEDKETGFKEGLENNDLRKLEPED